MARAYNIHVVICEGEVAAAFTVRHELDRWLEKTPAYGLYEIVTVRDGGRRPCYDPLALAQSE